MPVAGELNANVSSGHSLHKVSNLLPMITGAGAKYSFIGTIFANTTVAAASYSTIDTLFFKLHETAGSARIQSHQGPIHCGVTVVTAPKGSVHAKVTVIAAPKVQPRWCNGRSSA